MNKYPRFWNLCLFFSLAVIDQSNYEYTVSLDDDKTSVIGNPWIQNQTEYGEEMGIEDELCFFMCIWD